MLRSNEVILILLLVFLRRRIAYQISPVITEICWLLLAMRLLLPEAISVKLNVLGQQKTAQMEFKSLFVGWRWIGCSILCIATVCMTASFYWKLRGKCFVQKIKSIHGNGNIRCVCRIKYIGRVQFQHQFPVGYCASNCTARYELF